MSELDIKENERDVRDLFDFNRIIDIISLCYDNEREKVDLYIDLYGKRYYVQKKATKNEEGTDTWTIALKCDDGRELDINFPRCYNPNDFGMYPEVSCTLMKHDSNMPPICIKSSMVIDNNKPEDIKKEFEIVIDNNKPEDIKKEFEIVSGSNVDGYAFTEREMLLFQALMSGEIERSKQQNYLCGVKKYIDYEKISSLIERLSRMLGSENTRNGSDNYFPVVAPNGTVYQVIKEGNELIIADRRGKKLVICLSLGHAYDKDTGMSKDWGRVNFRFEINDHSAIIFTDAFEDITTYYSLGNVGIYPIKRINPVYRINYGKYFEVASKITDDYIGDYDDHELTFTNIDEQDKIAAEMASFISLLISGKIKDYIIDSNDLALIISTFDGYYDGKLDTNGNRLRKV